MTDVERAPILILGTQEDFSLYTCEILKTEGFNNLFDIKLLSQWEHSPVNIEQYNAVILGASDIPNGLFGLIDDYVKSGGGLIAFKPCRKLLPLAGLTGCASLVNCASLAGSENPDGHAGHAEPTRPDSPAEAPGTLADAYIKFTPHELTAGLIDETMQFHGAADLYALSGAQQVAALCSDACTPAGHPAVALNRYGRGQVISFTYNLPLSIALTRQGNPALAGVEADGIPGLRAAEMFTGGWVNASKNNINQADEQMRLLSRCVEYLAAAAGPLPRLWYFPDALKCVAALTNDGEGNNEAEFAAQFDEIEAKQARMTLYIMRPEKVSDGKAAEWAARGHEISGHPDGAYQSHDPSWATMDALLGSMKAAIKSKYGADMRTVANHWFVWCGRDSDGRADFAAQAKIEAKNGLLMDMNYSDYDIANTYGERYLGRDGNFTGSGLPMRFTDCGGNVIDVYQVLTNIYDQQYMEADDKEGFFNRFKNILDRSLDGGVYSVIGIKAHYCEWHWTREPILKMLEYAAERRVPVRTAEKLLDFLLLKDAAGFENVRYRDDMLNFNVASPGAAGGLTLMIPRAFGGKELRRIIMDGADIKPDYQTVKGKEYAFVVLGAGSRYMFGAEYA